MRGYLDLWTGLSGDMMVGALLDAGWSEEAMRSALAALPFDEVQVVVESRSQNGIQGRGIRVEATDPPPSRSHREIRQLLTDACLPARVRDRSLGLFARLAEVEGEIHGIDPQEVHFHELGAVDSIADIVLTVAGLEGLEIDSLACGPIPLSRGEVETEHGLLPVPAPATLRLLEGKPIHWLPIEGEWLTPTGALILTGLVDSFGPPPPMHLERVGTGAGSRSFPDRPNIVRLLVGSEEEADEERIGWISVIEANIDDMDPRHQAEAADRLLEAGALDLMRIPASMKKGRSGTLFVVLCRPDREERLGNLLLQLTSTLGVRIRREFRKELVRRTETVETVYGTVRIKWSRPGRCERPVAEFADLKARSREAGVPTWEVERAALDAARLDRVEPPAPDAP